MGIDIYMHWRAQTPEEAQAQITGFSTTGGSVGYLREAYHGAPYATRYLVSEAFNNEHPEFTEEQWEEYKGELIPAAVLRERLPTTVFLALARNALVYDDPFAPKFEFNSLPEETLDPTLSEEVREALTNIFAGIDVMQHGGIEFGIASNLTAEQLAHCKRLIELKALPDYALAFVEFVELAERKEAELNQPVKVYASY